MRSESLALAVELGVKKDRPRKPARAVPARLARAGQGRRPGSAKITKGDMEVGLSLGSNLGERLKNLSAAKEHIARIGGVKIMAGSPVYETEPVGVEPGFRDKPFLNAVLIIECKLTPSELARQLRDVEAGMGRSQRRSKNEPRVIDIDIVYAGAESIRTSDLTIPHPRWAGRRFVVQPLADVRPDLVVPGQTCTVRKILASLPTTPKAVALIREW